MRTLAFYDFYKIKIILYSISYTECFHSKYDLIYTYSFIYSFKCIYTFYQLFLLFKDNLELCWNVFSSFVSLNVWLILHQFISWCEWKYKKFNVVEPTSYWSDLKWLWTWDNDYFIHYRQILKLFTNHSDIYTVTIFIDRTRIDWLFHISGNRRTTSDSEIVSN